MRLRRMLVPLFLLVALVPLRGWTAVVMHLPAFAPAALQGVPAFAPAAPQVPVSAPSSTHEPTWEASAAAPCHDAEPGSASGRLADNAAGTTPDSAACVLCDLCGGSVLVGRVEAFHGGVTGTTHGHTAASARLPAGAPDPLLRPPRS
jgi:hypothetical protein